MLDDKFKKLATDQISLAFADQDAQNDLDVAAKNTELSNRNMIYASWAARSIGELFGQEIRRRGDTALEKVKLVASTLKIPATDDFETELTAFMEDLLGSEVVKLREKLNNQPTLRGKAGQDATPSYVQMGNEAFDEAVGHMFKKLYSEIALYAATSNDSEDQPEPNSTPRSTDRWLTKTHILMIFGIAVAVFAWLL